MKRFYEKAEAVAVAENGQPGFGVTIDGRTLRTPAKRPMVLPTAALAEAIAAEWQAQADEVRPHTMPLMRLASTGIDIVEQRREAVIEEVAKYAGTDLVCYRAAEPPSLVARQQAAWGPLVDWATLRYDAPLTVTSGIVPVAQSPNTLRAFRTAVEAYPSLALTALQAATAACGSLVIALALMEGRIGAEEAFAASQVDETFQIEAWGEDSEAASRRLALAADIEAAARFRALLRG
jgi:chaperone required for assembly of F1-ATPase